MRARSWRPVAVVLLALQIAGCATWRPVDSDPARCVREETPSRIGVTLTDGSREEIRRPMVRGDSLVRADVSDEGVPLAEVELVEERRTDYVASGIGVVLLTGLVALIAGFAAFRHRMQLGLFPLVAWRGSHRPPGSGDAVSRLNPRRGLQTCDRSTLPRGDQPPCFRCEVLDQHVLRGFIPIRRYVSRHDEALTIRCRIEATGVAVHQDIVRQVEERGQAAALERGLSRHRGGHHGPPAHEEDLVTGIRPHRSGSAVVRQLPLVRVGVGERANEHLFPTRFVRGVRDPSAIRRKRWSLLDEVRGDERAGLYVFPRPERHNVPLALRSSEQTGVAKNDP